MEIQRDTIFIQDLPKDVTKEQLSDAFSGVGRIKIDDRNGGPKVWLYKDRMTDEGNGRATVTYEDEETAGRAISEYNDQHIESLGVTVRVQQAQRRPRTNDRGGFGGGGSRGYRGGRSGWDSSNSRSGGGFSSDGNRWGGSRGGSSGGSGFSDSRDNYRSQGGFGGSSGSGGDSYRNSDDRDGGYRGGSQHRGASRSRGGVSNYSPY